MIYAKITGNAGNQFFQYAFARKVMLTKRDKLTIDLKYIIKGDGVHKAENVLDYFNVCDYKLNLDGKYYPPQKILFNFLVKFINKISPMNNINGIRRFEFLRMMSKLFCRLGLIFYDGPDYLKWNLKSIKTRDCFIHGFWECDKYFDDIRDVLLEEFTPKSPVLEENKELYKLIQESESICVTVRKFDMQVGLSENFYTLDKIHFYNGVNYIRQSHPNAKVFVFSDNIEWCRENLDFGVETYYESGKDPIWEKVRLMSACKHFVISNSSFSWWVQYLSRNENKIIVAPVEWRLKECLPIDIYQDNWTYLDRDGNLTTHK